MGTSAPATAITALGRIAVESDMKLLAEIASGQVILGGNLSLAFARNRTKILTTNHANFRRFFIRIRVD